jgi:hypothetical protein
MSGNTLTAASVLQCPHGGTVAVVAASSTTIASVPVATIADTYPIAGCTLVTNPCVIVQWIVPDVRVRTTLGPTLSQSSVGLCINALGVPQGAVVVVTTQPKVTTQ